MAFFLNSFTWNISTKVWWRLQDLTYWLWWFCTFHRRGLRKILFSPPFEMHNAWGRVKGGESRTKLKLVNKLWSKVRKHISRGEMGGLHTVSGTPEFSGASTSHCWVSPILREITKNQGWQTDPWLTSEECLEMVFWKSLYHRSKRMKGKSSWKKK